MAAQGMALHLRRVLLPLTLSGVLLAGTGTAFADTFSTLYRFAGDANGNAPIGPLVRATDGNLYGTATGSSGNQTFGTIFRVTPAGVLTTLYTFNGTANGQDPVLSVQASDGYLYGVTTSGGSPSASGQAAGTVFKATADGVLTSLYTFTGGADGGKPVILTRGTDGNLYGITQTGGIATACGGTGCGTVFKMTTSGILTTLYSFSGGADGAPGIAAAALMQDSDGNLYGTTSGGGNPGPCGRQSTLGLESSGCGTIFKLTSSGTLTTLHAFSGTADGSAPNALLQGADGNLYGSTFLGGAAGVGTIFRITTAGVLTTLYTFSGGSDSGAPDWFLQGSDGNFYGTTYGLIADVIGGNGSADDTLFEVTPSGVLTTLHAFSVSDGVGPTGMAQGGDGNLYGIAAAGTSSSAPRYGSIFRETLSTGASSAGGGAMSFPVIGMLALGWALRQRRRPASRWSNSVYLTSSC